MKNKFKIFYQWILKNKGKLFTIIIVHFLLTILLYLPYINLIYLVITFFQYLVDWILILVLFHPAKRKILIVGIALYGINYFLYLLKINSLVEWVGNVSYFMIATYVLFSIKELRKPKNKD